MSKKCKITKYYLVKIEFKKPEGVVYKTMRVSEYHKFLKRYTEKTSLKGLEISKIKREKKYKIQDASLSSL